MRIKRYLCLITAVICLIVSALTASSFTIQSYPSCQCADNSGAYRITWNGEHADITRCTSGEITAGLDLNVPVSTACACRGRIVFFCDDTPNNQLYVYVYDWDSGMPDSFGIYDAKLYGGTDFGCDENAIYLENHKNSKELLAYSYDGALLNRYSFQEEITAVFSGYTSGIYAVGGNRLYQLKNGQFTCISGTSVDAPLFSASDQVVASAFGKVYVINGGRIKRSFTTDTDHRAVSACVIGSTLYYPCGSFVYGYDIESGEKVSYYRTDFAPVLLYADGDRVLAADDASSVSISRDAFTSLIQPQIGDDPQETARTGDQNSDKTTDDSKSSGSADSDTGDKNRQNAVSAISSDVYRVDFTKRYITGISPGTSLAAFKANMNYEGYSAAFYRGSTQVKSGSVCTAMKAVFTSGSGSTSFELCVAGDMTGEGNCNSRDLNLLMDCLIGAADCSGVYAAAADLYADGKVDVRDLAMMKRAI